MNEIDIILNKAKKEFNLGNNKEVNNLLSTLLKMSLTENTKDEIKKMYSAIQLDKHAVLLGSGAAVIALLIVVFIFVA